MWCVADGFQIGTVYAFANIKLGVDTPLKIELQPLTDTDFTVQDEDGKPVEGARVEPQLYFDGAAFESIPGSVRALIAGTTDEKGRVELPAFASEELFVVHVIADGYGIQQLVLKEQPSDPDIDTIMLRRAGRLEGQFVCEDPSAWKNLSVSIIQKGQIGRYTSATADVKVNADGSFVVPALAEGNIRLIIQWDDPSFPKRPQIPDSIIIVAGETEKLTIPFENVVEVRGRVQTKGEERGVEGGRLSIRYGANGQSETVYTDDQGRFTARVLPGRVRQLLVQRPVQYRQWMVDRTTYQSSLEVPAGAVAFDLPPIELIHLDSLKEKLVDSKGKPLSGYRVYAIAGNRRYRPSRTDVDGNFSIQHHSSVKVDKYEVADLARGIQRTDAKVLTESPLVISVEP